MQTKRRTTAAGVAAWCAGIVAMLAGTPAGMAQLDLSNFGKPTYNDSRDRVGVSVVAAKTKVMPGGDIPLAIVLDHDPGWHIHTNRPPTFDKFKPIPTQVRVDVPSDAPITAYPNLIQWPQIHTIEADFTGSSDPYPVFDGKAVVYLPLTVAADAKPGTWTVNVFVQFQACDEKACLTPTPLFVNDMFGREPVPYPVQIEIVAVVE